MCSRIGFHLDCYGCHALGTAFCRVCLLYVWNNKCIFVFVNIFGIWWHANFLVHCETCSHLEKGILHRNISLYHFLQWSHLFHRLLWGRYMNTTWNLWVWGGHIRLVCYFPFLRCLLCLLNSVGMCEGFKRMTKKFTVEGPLLNVHGMLTGYGRVFSWRMSWNALVDIQMAS